MTIAIIIIEIQYIIMLIIIDLAQVFDELKKDNCIIPTE